MGGRRGRLVSKPLGRRRGESTSSLVVWAVDGSSEIRPSLARSEVGRSR